MSLKRTVSVAQLDSTVSMPPPSFCYRPYKRARQNPPEPSVAELLKQAFASIRTMASTIEALESRLAKIEEENQALCVALTPSHPLHPTSTLGYTLRQHIEDVVSGSGVLGRLVEEISCESASATATLEVGTLFDRELQNKLPNAVEDALESTIRDRLSDEIVGIMRNHVQEIVESEIETHINELSGDVEAISLRIQERVSSGLTRQIEDTVKYAVLDALPEPFTTDD